MKLAIATALAIFVLIVALYWPNSCRSVTYYVGGNDVTIEVCE